MMIPASPRGAQSADGGSLGTYSQSQASSHVSEIDWKTNQGRKVAALKMMETSIGEHEGAGHSRDGTEEWEKVPKEVRSRPRQQVVSTSSERISEQRYARADHSKPPKEVSLVRGGDGTYSSKESRSNRPVSTVHFQL